MQASPCLSAMANTRSGSSWGQLRKIEEARRCGISEVLTRLDEGRWYVDDIVDVLRFGLIGGGLSPEKATQLISLYVEPVPLQGHVLTAKAALLAVLIGLPDDPIAETSEGNQPAPVMMTGAGQ